MTDVKLSQIPASPANAGASDSFVGVGSGPIDYRYSLAQISGGLQSIGAIRTVLTANANYYVSTTGSNSNDGLTVGTAWATVQHAMDVIAASIDIASFTITVNIGIGTFSGLAVKSCVGDGTIKFYGGGASSTTIVDGPNDGVYNFGECVDVIGYCTTFIVFDHLTFKNTGVNNNEVIVFYHWCFLILGNPQTPNIPDIVCDLSSIPAGGVVVDMQDAGNCVDFGMNYTGGGASIAYGILLEGTPLTVYSCSTMTISGSLTITGAFLKIINGGSYNANGNAYVAAGTTGQRYDIGTNSSAAAGPSNSGTIVPGFMGPNYLPGNSPGTVNDPSSIYDGYPFFQSISGLPSTTQLNNPGSWAMFKDTSGGGLYLAANDAGVIKKVALT